MKKLFSLFLSLFMVTSLVGCGGSNNTEEEQPVQEEVEPEQKYAYVIENDVVKIEIDDPITVEDISVPVFQSAVTNLTDVPIKVKHEMIEPGQTSENCKLLYEEFDDFDYCPIELYVFDSQDNVISSVFFHVTVDDEGKIDLFEVVKNEAISTGLSNALKVEQISDASYINDGKMACGLTYHSEALLKVTNTSDMTILIYENYDEQIVLKPGESTEISGKTTSACDASSDLPFTVQIEFYEYTGSDDPSDYINKTPTFKTIEITH